MGVLTQNRPRLVATIAYLTSISLGVELLLIFLQALRGTTSHFNQATTFDSAVFSIMGGFVVIIFSMGVLVTLLLLFCKLSDPAWAWSLRMGMFIALVGMGVATLMLMPTTEQLAALHVTQQMPISGAHTVGAADGGPGLPFLGWSTIAGDLRVPHFFGLHGIQILLVIGWTVAQTKSWLRVRYRVGIIFTAGISYLGFVMLLTWQALRAHSLIHPDALTLTAFGALVAGAALAIGSLLLLGRRDALQPQKLAAEQWHS